MTFEDVCDFSFKNNKIVNNSFSVIFEVYLYAGIQTHLTTQDFFSSSTLSVYLFRFTHSSITADPFVNKI